MLTTLFGSKNKKIVKSWTKEHEQMISLAHQVKTRYMTHDIDGAKAALRELNKVVQIHIMAEDMEFFRMQKDKKRLTPVIEQQIATFKETFKETKDTLRDFLLKYTKPDAELNDEFLKKFIALSEVLEERISFEEESLYRVLTAKK